MPSHSDHSSPESGPSESGSCDPAALSRRGAGFPDRRAVASGPAAPRRRPGSSRAPTEAPDLDAPIAVFRVAAEHQVSVKGAGHARALCQSLHVPSGGFAVVFAALDGDLLAIAVAPWRTTNAVLRNVDPLARLAEQLAASRIYLSLPVCHADEVVDALGQALWPVVVCIESIGTLPSAA